MTVLSQVSAGKFCSHVKFVFPEDEFFNPLDYLEIFNDGREAAGMSLLGENTFKKYLALVCETEYFPELSRERNDTLSPYEYFVDTSINGSRRRISSKKKKSLVSSGSSDTSSLAAPLSDKSLKKFMERVAPLMKPGYNRVETLRRRYNRQIGYNSLKKHTFSYYISLVYRMGVWEGLERKFGKKRTYEYCFESVKKKSTVQSSKRHSNVPPALRVERDEVACSFCPSSNPLKAKFCMECGGSLGTRVKALIQERVVNISLPSIYRADEGSQEQAIKEEVKGWIVKRLDISLETTKDGLLAVVDIKGDSRG